MNKANPFRALKTRPLGMRTALAMVTAFLGLILADCLCGPACGSRAREDGNQTVIGDTGECCSGCTSNAKPARNRCCSDESGSSCHLTAHAELQFLQPVPDDTLDIMEHAAEPIDSGLPALKALARTAPPLTDAATGPPPYILFEILRI